MARNIDPTLLTAFQSDSVEIFFAVEMQFDSGFVRMWTGIGPKTIDSKIYTGVGSFLGISGAGENLDLSSSNAYVTLSGVDSGLISLALQEPYQGRACKIYMGSGSLAVEVFSGFMDTMPIVDSGETSTITISVESRLILLDRINPRRYTNETQSRLYPGDWFFSYVESLQDKPVVWGRDER
jgi:hypothetical protein